MNLFLRLAIRAAFYPSLIFNRMMCVAGVWHRWDWVDPQLALGALPTRRELERLRDAGVGGIVNMCSEFPGHRETMARCGIEQIHLPTVDFQSPGLADIDAAIAFIQRIRAAGAKVYVHCKAGRGRGATVAIAYLMQTRGLTLEAAWRAVAAARPQIDRRLRRRTVLQQLEQRQTP